MPQEKAIYEFQTSFHTTWEYPVYVGWAKAPPKAKGKEILVQDLPQHLRDSTLTGLY